MLEKIKATVTNPEFQRKSAQVAASLTTTIVMLAVSGVVHKLVETGVDALMDKIQNKDVAAE